MLSRGLQIEKELAVFGYKGVNHKNKKEEVVAIVEVALKFLSCVIVR